MHSRKLNYSWVALAVLLLFPGGRAAMGEGFSSGPVTEPSMSYPEACAVLALSIANIKKKEGAPKWELYDPVKVTRQAFFSVEYFSQHLSDDELNQKGGHQLITQPWVNKESVLLLIEEARRIFEATGILLPHPGEFPNPPKPLKEIKKLHGDDTTIYLVPMIDRTKLGLAVFITWNKPDRLEYKSFEARAFDQNGKIMPITLTGPEMKAMAGLNKPWYNCTRYKARSENRSCRVISGWRQS